MHSKLARFSISQQFIDQMPGLFVVLDKQSRFMMANNSAKQWTGFKSTDEMIGKTYHEMPCKASEQHEDFVTQDRLILNNKGHGQILGLYCYADNDWKAVFAEKYPLKNAEGEIIALATHISDITHSNIIDISRFLQLTTNKYPVKFRKKQNGFLIQSRYPDITLSKRQNECLFFLLRGKSNREIAKLLSISVRTVEHYIEAIKRMMDCTSKSQLVEKAIAAGYMNIIPDSLCDLFS